MSGRTISLPCPSSCPLYPSHDNSLLHSLPRSLSPSRHRRAGRTAAPGIPMGRASCARARRLGPCGRCRSGAACAARVLGAVDHPDKPCMRRAPSAATRYRRPSGGHAATGAAGRPLAACAQRGSPTGAAGRLLPVLSGQRQPLPRSEPAVAGAAVVGAVAHPAAPGDDESRDAGRPTRVCGMIAWLSHGTSPVTPTLRVGPGPDLDPAVPVLSAAPGRLRGRAGPGLRPDVDLGDGGRGGRAWGGCGFPSRSTAGSRWGTCASSTRAPATPGPRPAPARLAPPLMYGG